MPEKITQQYIEDEMKQSYLDYGMSVIIGRALPDVRDGLKPVHRRILYAMYQMGLTHDKPFKKCARVVGDTLGRYHPHGDTAVYDALVRMAQPFALRYPLIQGQGNFGSIDGDAPAAMRYTECRLTSFASECLKDINKDTVRFVPNFDASLKEPTCLPALPPLLLLNGSTGIAVGMATNIPPHNLAETVDAITAYIENPSITIDELMQHIKGPDFPTGALIIGSKGIISAYKTGKGKIKIRARCEIEGNKIIIKEIPFMLNKSSLIEEIASLVREGKIDGITDIRDESSRGELRVVLILKKTINPEIVLKQLYLHTRLQTTFGMIFLALVDGVPTLLNLKDIIAHYVSHRKTVITKRLQFDLTQASKREHIVKGLLTALSNIEKTISIIKKSRSPAEASTALMQAFAITKEQAKAILEMPLQKLTALESTALEEEHKKLTEQIKKLRFILSSEKEILNIIKEELQQLKKKYADERRTAILPEEEEITIEEIIVPELSIVTITKNGFIKRTSLALFKRQRRGGKGLSTIYSAEDVVEQLFLAKTTAQLLVFTNKGKVHWIPVYKLPDVTRYGKGKHISAFIQLGKDEKIATIIPIEEFKNNLIMVTKKGIVKKLPLAVFKRPRRGGILAISLSDDDSLIGVIHAKEEDELLIATRRGMALRFKAAEVRAMGRAAKGVKGIHLKEKDSVIGIVKVEPEKAILTVTEKGFGKRTPAELYRLTHRASIGVRNIICTEKNGFAVAIASVSDKDEVIIATKLGSAIRIKAKEIPLIGRATRGVRLMKLSDQDTVISITVIKEELENV